MSAEEMLLLAGDWLKGQQHILILFDVGQQDSKEDKTDHK